MRYEPSEPQRLAGEHLLRHDRAALFMGCGLGKTAVVLHSLLHLIDDGACKGALIVAPLRVCNLTWPAELHKWDGVRDLRMVNLRTRAGQDAFERGAANLYLVNYDQLQQLAQRLKGRRSVPFDTVVWDELSRAKNHKSKRVNAMRVYLRRWCVRHWGMTGTPAPNGLLDLFAQVRLLDDGERLGREFTLFRDTYFRAEDWGGYNWQPLPTARRDIYARLADFALTLRSSDWLGIPDTVQEDVELTLPAPAVAQYRELEKELVLLLEDGGEVVAQSAAVLVNKLLQLTGGACYDAEKHWHRVHDGKLDALDKLLHRIGKRPVLLAYQFRHELARLRARFPQLVSFSDARTDAEQVSLVNRWNAGKIPLLAAHPRSMAHGLNMQDGGETVVWYSLPWSREDYDQMNARLARRGQDEVTTIYRLVTTNTMDEVVAEALRSKDDEQTALLEALKAWHENKSLM
jgi:SNF2 family DNA or RNA helicase